MASKRCSFSRSWAIVQSRQGKTWLAWSLVGLVALACGDGSGQGKTATEDGNNETNSAPPNNTSSASFEPDLEPLIEKPDPILLSDVTRQQLGHFATSLTCSNCHSNSQNSAAMKTAAGEPVAPFDLWQASMMANAFRDPLFRAVVSVEMAATPAIAGAIQDKCMTCHAPMAAHEAHLAGGTVELADAYGTDTKAQMALDGISCTVCHQMPAEGLGAPSTYSGGFQVNSTKRIFGPHANPVSGPMVNNSGYTPAQGSHMVESALCASCHTLYTDAYRPDGTAVGKKFPEQTVYLEWRNSDFTTEVASPGPAAATCQGCHMPNVDEFGTPIRTRIARRPNGDDFRQVEPREPFGQHIFVGGNTLIPAILRDNAAELNPLASAAAFNRTIALATENLQQRTATLAIQQAERDEQMLRFAVRVENLTGHKFPTGIPIRRAWLRVTIKDASGKVIFLSGEINRAGKMIDREGKVLESEKPGGPLHPHYEQITAESQVQIYESLMADEDNNSTMNLMRATSHLKDNRLLPRGWRADHPDAADTLPVGTTNDSSFADGADSVLYEVALPETPEATGPLSVEVSLFYQVLSARFAAELFEFDTPEVKNFQYYYQSANRIPVEVAQTTALVSPL